VKKIFLILVILVLNSLAMDNLSMCLSGKFKSLCNYSLLTNSQKKMAREAERLENLNICLNGKFSALCNYSLLSNSELKEAKEAERIENLNVCLNGKFKSLCKHHLLSLSEKINVKKAEEAENLRICLNGNLQALCNHSLLTSKQKTEVIKLESKVKNIPYNTIAIKKPMSQYKRVSQCESGHWIESNEQSGEIIILEDGSIWEVSDTLDSSLWLPLSSITVCPYSLINTDDNERVDAYKIR
jgi:hypothetical protein